MLRNIEGVLQRIVEEIAPSPLSPPIKGGENKGSADSPIKGGDDKEKTTPAIKGGKAKKK